MRQIEQFEIGDVVTTLKPKMSELGMNVTVIAIGEGSVVCIDHQERLHWYRCDEVILLKRAS